MQATGLDSISMKIGTDDPVTKYGKCVLHKAKQNSNLSFSKGKTWALEDMRTMEQFGVSRLVVLIELDRTWHRRRSSKVSSLCTRLEKGTLDAIFTSLAMSRTVSRAACLRDYEAAIGQTITSAHTSTNPFSSTLTHSLPLLP